MTVKIESNGPGADEITLSVFEVTLEGYDDEKGLWLDAETLNVLDQGAEGAVSKAKQFLVGRDEDDVSEARLVSVRPLVGVDIV